MRIRLFIAICLLVALTGPANAFGIQKRVCVRHDFDLKAGTEAFVKEAGLKVKFTELVEDSRCPEGVDCIWAGNGKITMSVKKGRHKTVTFDLNTSLEPQSFVYQRYEIKLVRLSPYPKHDVTTKKEEYVATVKVSRAK